MDIIRNGVAYTLTTEEIEEAYNIYSRSLVYNNLLSEVNTRITEARITDPEIIATLHSLIDDSAVEALIERLNDNEYYCDIELTITRDLVTEILTVNGYTLDSLKNINN